MNTVVVIIIVFFGICCADDVATKFETENTAAAVTEFSLDLLKKLHEEGKNTFFSGYSIAVAMGLATLCARENTLTEIDDTLHFDKVNVNDSSTIHKAFKSFAATYNKQTTNFILTTANRLYGSKLFKIEQQYQEDSKKFYGGDLQLVDFTAGTAEDVINNWVASQTNEKIKSLFPPGTFDADTVLVLVNTIYFKANWVRQFRTEYTKTEKFSTIESTGVDVHMMRQISFLNYYHDTDLKVKILELPYVGNDLSMFILLPEVNTGLPALISSLTKSTLQYMMNSVASHNVEVRLPRFRVESEHSLVKVLKSLGVNDLFDQHKCNISAIVGQDLDGSIYVSKAIHKTFVQVAEEGTEAAAVTGMQIMLMSVPVAFNVNHPFLFVIRDNVHKIPLFVGAISDPPVAEESVSNSE